MPSYYYVYQSNYHVDSSIKFDRCIIISFHYLIPFKTFLFITIKSNFYWLPTLLRLFFYLDQYDYNQIIIVYFHFIPIITFDSYTIWIMLAKKEIKRAYLSYFFLLFFYLLFILYFLNLVGSRQNRVFTVAPLYLLVAKKSELLVYEASKDKNTYFVRPDNRRK